MHGYNYRGLMDKVGLRPQVYKSGKFKDMLSGDKQLDPEKQTALEKEEIEAETRMVQSLIDQTFDKFKSIVAEGRRQANDKNKSSPDEPGVKLSRQWTDYADGRVLSGKEAHRLGFPIAQFIDQSEIQRLFAGDHAAIGIFGPIRRERFAFAFVQAV